jgi:hypothetical protein
MRFQRLLLESDGTSVSVDLHPRLTVLAGVGPLERASLVSELLGGLASSRPGTHLQIVEPNGRRLGVIRFGGERDRVFDLDTYEDVTEEFRTEDGHVDVLQATGVDLATAKRLARMTAADMASLAKEEGVIVRLAAHAQPELWSAAERLHAANESMKEALASIGADPEDAPLVEEIERRHAEFDAACSRLEFVRHHGIFIGGACVAGALPAVAMSSPAAFPLLAVAIITTLVSIAYRRRMQRARAEERRLLDVAGAESYLAFRLQSVSRVLEGHGDRSGLRAIASQHQQAAAEWRELVGDVSVAWALDTRARIENAAAQIRIEDSEELLSAADVEPSDLAQALIARLSTLRNIGDAGRSLPLLLDEPLAGAETSVKTWMLELIRRSAGRPQIIYMTNDPDVADWARIEAISGELSIIEPTPAAASSTEVLSLPR